jgi:hypothetical protein
LGGLIHAALPATAVKSRISRHPALNESAEPEQN